MEDSFCNMDDESSMKDRKVDKLSWVKCDSMHLKSDSYRFLDSETALRTCITASRPNVASSA